MNKKCVALSAVKSGDVFYLIGKPFVKMHTEPYSFGLAEPRAVFVKDQAKNTFHYLSADQNVNIDDDGVRRFRELNIGAIFTTDQVSSPCRRVTLGRDTYVYMNEETYEISTCSPDWTVKLKL